MLPNLILFLRCQSQRPLPLWERASPPSQQAQWGEGLSQRTDWPPIEPLIRQPSAATFSHKGRREELDRRKERQRRAGGWFEHHFYLLPDLQTLQLAVHKVGLQRR